MFANWNVAIKLFFMAGLPPVIRTAHVLYSTQLFWKMYILPFRRCAMNICLFYVELGTTLCLETKQNYNFLKENEVTVSYESPSKRRRLTDKSRVCPTPRSAPWWWGAGQPPAQRSLPSPVLWPDPWANLHQIKHSDIGSQSRMKSRGTGSEMTVPTWWPPPLTLSTEQKEFDKVG